MCRPSVYAVLFLLLLLLLLNVGCSQKIDSYEEFCELALRHERDNELPQAVVAYKKALELQPLAAVTWYDLGVAHVQLDHLDDAQAAYSKAIELDPTLAMAYNNRATVWAEKRQFEKAIDDFSQAIKLDPRDALAWRNRGLAHFDLGQFEAARANYETSIQIDDRNPATYLYRGNALLELGLFDRAVRDYDTALTLDESLVDAWLNRARALIELGQPEAAQESADRAQTLGADIRRFSLEPRRTTSDSPAVDAVRTWLLERDQVADPADFPWHLKTTDGNGEVRYLVREVTHHDQQSDVRFSREELDGLNLASNVRTTLVLVENRATSDSSDVWTVVHAMDDWQPDVSVMQPEIWSLPVDAKETQP